MGACLLLILRPVGKSWRFDKDAEPNMNAGNLQPKA